MATLLTLVLGLMGSEIRWPPLRSVSGSPAWAVFLKVPETGVIEILGFH